MSVESLTAAQLHAAVAQITSAPNFAAANPHLSALEIVNIRQSVWPRQKPVFTPYAVTHSGYSQIRFEGIKYLIHRITLQSLFGTLTSASDELSHVVYLGRVTSSYVCTQGLSSFLTCRHGLIMFGISGISILYILPLNTALSIRRESVALCSLVVLHWA